MASRRIADLHPLLAYAFGKAEAEWNLARPNAPTPFITCTFRSFDEQTALYNQPTDKKDNDGDGRIDEADEKVTNAKAGRSPHNFQPALAFDVAFKKPDGSLNWNPELYRLFADLVLKTPGITWGGSFKAMIDHPHFELTDWRELAARMGTI